MLFVNMKNPDALFQCVGDCEGGVYYLDANGVRHDLKRVASQMLAFARPFRPRDIPALEVLAERPADRSRLMRLMMDAHYRRGA